MFITIVCLHTFFGLFTHLQSVDVCSFNISKVSVILSNSQQGETLFNRLNCTLGGKLCFLHQRTWIFKILTKELDISGGSSMTRLTLPVKIIPTVTAGGAWQCLFVSRLLLFCFIRVGQGSVVSSVMVTTAVCVKLKHTPACVFYFSCEFFMCVLVSVCLLLGVLKH